MSFRVTHGDKDRKLSPKDQAIWDRLFAVYKAATDEEKKMALAISERAKRCAGKEETEIMTLSPGVAAVLFFDYNKQNREWNPASSSEYAEQVDSGNWHLTSQGLSVLETGNMGDGQHRLAMIILSGKEVRITVFFGMAVAAIIALDSQKRRQPSNYLDIVKSEHDSKRKQTVVKRAYAYLVACSKDDESARPYILRRPQDVVKAVDDHRALLEEALRIADDSVVGRPKNKETLSPSDAAAIRSRPRGWLRINVRRARRPHIEGCAQPMALVSSHCGLTSWLAGRSIDPH